METRDRIVDAACAAILDKGVTDVTVADVGKRSRVSTALVHYHFATKERLLGAACERLAARRAAARSGALRTARGLDALDALWAAVATGVGAEVERAWRDVGLLARRDPAVRTTLASRRREEMDALTATIPRLLADLGASIPLPADEVAAAVLVFLDGVALALDSGAPVTEVRAAYDAFWLVLVAGGPARGS